MALGKYALAGLALGAAYVAIPAGHSDRPRIFAQPAATAIERIEAQRRIVNGTGLGSLTIASDGGDQRALLIGVRRAGERRSVECRVAVSPVSAGESRADVDCTQPNVAAGPARDLGARALAIVVREHVAAAIEDRPYDTDRVADSLIAFVAMNGPAIAASMRSPRG